MPRGRPRTATRTTRSRTRVFKNATIGRFDGEMHPVAFKEGDKVSDLLTRANLSISKGMEINDEMGNTISESDNAKETTYYITGNFVNGK